MNKLWIIGLLFMPLVLFGQDDTIRTDEIVIIRAYEPTVSDAFKIGTYPSIYDSAVEPPQVKYSVLTKHIANAYEVDPIKAARMKGDKLNTLSKAYFKAGFGNYTNNLFEFYLNNTRSRKHHIGLELNHFGSNGGLDNVGFNGFGNQRASVYGKKFLREHLVFGDIGYDRKTVRYYGYPNEVFVDSLVQEQGFDKSNTKQIFSKVSAVAGLKSFYRDSSKTNFDVTARYYNLTDNFNVMENNVRLDGEFVKFFQPGWSEFMNNEVITINSFVDYNGYSGSDSSFLDTSNQESYASTIIGLQPTIVSKGDKWRLDLGMNMNVELENGSKFHFYPKAHFKYNVLQEMLIPYAGIDGGVQRNSFNTLSENNPFVRSQIELKNTNNMYNAYVGVSGAFSSKVGFNFRATRSLFRDMPLYMHADSSELTFAVVYDTVKVTELSGQISLRSAEKLKLVFNGSYNLYEMKNALAPWYLPNLKVGVNAQYDLRDKIVLRADLFYVSSQKARSFNVEDKDLGFGVYEKTLPGFVDASVGIEYRYTKRFSAFLNINNLAAQKYYRWNNYPSQSLNVLGGFTYSFLER